MKYVSTARSYQALRYGEGDDAGVVDATPRKVSNEKAEEIEKLAEKAGIAVRVVDEADHDAAVEAGELVGAARNGATADLASGTSYAVGTGDPVLSPGTTPEGDTPAQADTSGSGTSGSGSGDGSQTLPAGSGDSTTTTAARKAAASSTQEG